MATGLLNELTDAMAEKPPDNVRNVCLIAHVDHGKTSLADSLVSTNAIISSRMAGKLRFMDNREDEQIRGITMKASGVSLLYGPLIVHLMDSPGHVDFASEVTSALLLSDISFLLIDVVEGVCSQTDSLLRQAITSGQTIVLVINKLDRLRVELKLSASEAYAHIVRLIGSVNSCISQVIAGLVLDDLFENIEEMEAKLHFDPVKGNVIFASAVHGFAFTVEDFAQVYCEKMKLDKTELAGGLFGDFYYHGGSVQAGASAKGRRVLFEQLVLEPLWQLMECGLVNNDLAKLTAMSERLGLPFKARRAEEAFDEVMRTWMPVPRACFRACARAPSARIAFSNEQRLNLLLGPGDHPLRNAIKACSVDGPTVLFVVKFFRNDEKKFAICRVMSGRVTKGQELYIIPPKECDEIVSTEVVSVSVLRGRECFSLKAANAGSICAIEAQGLIQNATLCSERISEAICVSREVGEPLVRVTVSTSDLDREEGLRDALKLLAVLDPSLRVLELETGELAMVTAGEVHLQKCLKDLEDLGYSELEVSQPIVPFLETVVLDPSTTQQQVLEQTTECKLRNDTLYLRLRCVPLPGEIVSFMMKNSDTLTRIRRAQLDDAALFSFRSKLEALCLENLPGLRGTWFYKKSKEEVSTIVDKIWSFGPDRARSNLLINSIPDYDRKSIWNRAEGTTRPLDQTIVAGFELFVNSGPLCHEAMQGVAVVVEDWRLNEEDSAASGQLISAVRATCKAASKKLGLRLVAAMYKCIVTTSTPALGKVHAVLAQRKAKVVSEDINEATGLFEVEALMPVVESFSFCDHLRTSTSGMASAQLQFSHWQTIDEDPYWQPSTLEEVEEFGLKGDSPNHARGYMDAVRRRKGLPTEDLIVVSAEKQRNLRKAK